MANTFNILKLKAGQRIWNNWRKRTPGVIDLRKAHLDYSNFSGFDLSNCDFSGALMRWANIGNTILRGSNLSRCSLIKSTLRGSECQGALFCFANLEYCSLVDTNVDGADFSDSRVFGSAVWSIVGKPSCQSNLIITPSGEPTITVDELVVAQFMYTMLSNNRIRSVLDTITSKVVLILGRFSPDRKAVLDAIRDELRKRDYVPVLVDFEKPSRRDITETVSTLAHMARFVIADITDAKSIPQELMAIVPALPSVPVQPLLLASQREYGMFEHFKRFPWMLEPYLYEDQNGLLAAITDKVIGPAEKKAKEQTAR
jgi:hypothetical protein